MVRQANGFHYVSSIERQLEASQFDHRLRNGQLTPPDVSNTPRHIAEDAGVAPALLNFARAYFQNNPPAPSAELLSALPGLAYTATAAAANSTEFNVQDFSAEVSRYCYLFVEEAYVLPPGSVTSMPCTIRHGIRPDRRCVRQDATRVILEFMGKRALDTYAHGYYESWNGE